MQNSNVESLFSDKRDLDKTDIVYQNVYNEINENMAKAKRLVDEMWKIYRPFAERNFTKELKEHFHERFWEMNLCVFFIKQGFNVAKKSSDFSPDILIKNGEQKIWIEATCPQNGEGANRVPEPIEEWKGHSTPREDLILLRYTNAIRSKYSQYLKYIRKRIVSPEDIFVVAVNGCQIPFSAHERFIPRIVKSVYPIGEFTIDINIKTKEILRQFHSHRDQIIKTENKNIRTNSFLTKEYRGISGVIFSNSHVVSNFIDKDIIFVHNYMAKNKIPEGYIQAVEEYSFEENGGILELKKICK